MLPVVLSGSNPAAWEGFSASQHHPLGPQVSSESSFFSIRNSLCLHLSSLLSHCLRRLGPHRCLAIFVLLTFLVSLVATLSSNLAILNGMPQHCSRDPGYSNAWNRQKSLLCSFCCRVDNRWDEVGTGHQGWNIPDEKWWRFRPGGSGKHSKKSHSGYHLKAVDKGYKRGLEWVS